MIQQPYGKAQLLGGEDTEPEVDTNHAILPVLFLPNKVLRMSEGRFQEGTLVSISAVASLHSEDLKPFDTLFTHFTVYYSR